MPSYRQSPDVEQTRVGDRTVIYHRVSRAALVLNPSGAAIFAVLGELCSQATMAARLQSMFPSVPAETVVADVAAFVDAIERHGLVVRDG